MRTHARARAHTHARGAKGEEGEAHTRSRASAHSQARADASAMLAAGEARLAAERLKVALKRITPQHTGVGDAAAGTAALKSALRARAEVLGDLAAAYAQALMPLEAVGAAEEAVEMARKADGKASALFQLPRHFLGTS